ncbi:MAG: SH3-like domain-containing protein [Candidatus Dormibacteraceae bacterium]
MNGVHDMGGQHGHGPVAVEPAEPVFHQPWEGRVYALMVLARARGLFNLDEMRRAIEEMRPPEYLAAGYYERWLSALERLLQEKAVTPEGLVPIKTRPEEPTPPPRPRHRVGSRVRIRVLNPRHHLRLPRYARGKIGVVEGIHGPHLLPDRSAHSLPPLWQPVYTVRFSARELWGEDGDPHDSVSLDLWEEYLE